MDNVDIVFRAIEMLYENDLIDLIEDDQTRKNYHKIVTDVLMETMKTYHRVDELENTCYIKSCASNEKKIDDDWN